MNWLAVLHILLFIFYAAICLWTIFRWRFFDIPGTNRKHLAAFFLLKVLAGLLLTLVYTYYYTDAAKADIHRYFNDSRIISQLLFSHPLAWLKIISGIGMQQPDVFVHLLPTQHFSHPGIDLATNNTFLIRLISLLNYFSFFNIYINTLFFSFLSFTGLVWLYKALQGFFDNFPQVLYTPLFLLPSLVFWGSGLLKETIVLFAIGLYLYTLMQWRLQPARFRVIWIIIALLVVAALKLYIAGLLVVCTLLLPLPLAAWRRVAVMVATVALLWQMGGDNLCGQVINKRNEFIELAKVENAGSVTDARVLQPSCETLFLQIPAAMANALLRPFVWEKGKVFQLVFAVENLLVFILIAFLLARFFKWPKGDKAWLAAFCLIFALLNYLVIGLSVPVMGAIVHYRVIATVFLVLGILCFVNLDKLKQSPVFARLNP